MRKIFCLSLLMLLLYATSHSQDNVISGKVTGTDKTPLQGVTVSVAVQKLRRSQMQMELTSSTCQAMLQN
jgi:hypothetical protein